MLLPFAAIILGLALLVWSADRFVEGSAATARYFGMPSLLIGMVIIGFGTSAPEMAVSALASMDGNGGIALGNAYGSNITNIALILGLTALLAPITVHSSIVRKELPLLIAITGLAFYQLWDYELSRRDAFGLLAVFAVIMGWTIWQGIRGRGDSLEAEVDSELNEHAMPIGKAVFWMIVGLLFLIASSRLLVWGAVTIAEAMGVSQLIIGLTIVAIGTSLPELAASLIAIRKGEHDIALGNVLGSNLFNTLAVVGIAGAIQPMAVPHEVLSRDLALVGILTIALFLMCYGFRSEGRISRIDGALLLSTFIGYTGWLAYSVAA